MVVIMKKMLILVLAIFSFSQGICNNINWGSPTPISDSGVNASDPRVVMDTSGNVTAAWVEGTVIKSSTYTSGTWSSPQTLSGSTATSPRLGIDSNGNVYAIWNENGVINTATKPSGGSFGAESSISSLTGGAASTPALAVDSSGDAIAVWERNGFIETATQLAGGNFGSVNAFSNATSDSPQVAIGSDGEAAIVWHAVASGADQILASVAPTVGGTWGTAQNLITAQAAGHNFSFPQIAANNGRIIAVWFRNDLSGSDFINTVVIGALHLEGAASWNQPIQISNITERNPANLTLKCGFDPNGNAIAVWTESPDGSVFNTSAATLQVQGTLQGPIIISSTVYDLQIDLSIDSTGTGLMPFMTFDGTNEVIQVTQAFIASFVPNAFSPSLTISNGSDNAFPRGATTTNGSTVNGAVVWINFDGSNTRINAVTGSKSVILPPTSLAVSQSANNFGAFIDYVNTITWTASTDPGLQGYAVYRDGIFFASAASSTTSIEDYNRAQAGTGSPVTYGIAAFDGQLQQSVIQTITLP